MMAQGEACDWESFKRTFLKKYFPSKACFKKESKFLRLEQGSMTIHEF